MTKKRKPRRNPFKVADIRPIVKTISLLAVDAEGFLKTLEETDFQGVLWVDAGDTTIRGLEYASTWLEKLRGAYRTHMLHGGITEPEEPSPRKSR